MTLETLTTLILGGGGGGALLGFLIKWRDGSRRARVEDEDTMVRRLEAENRRALSRADEAETEADRYRRERDTALDLASRLRRQILEMGGEAARDE